MVTKEEKMNFYIELQEGIERSKKAVEKLLQNDQNPIVKGFRLAEKTLQQTQGQGWDLKILLSQAMGQFLHALKYNSAAMLELGNEKLTQAYNMMLDIKD